MSVAQTIIEQLGGNKFVAMTGARAFAFSQQERRLQFRLPSNFAAHGINGVSITLTDADLYNVEFYKIRGVNFKPIEQHADIYADQLRNLFTTSTGLDVNL